jgi:glycosyltransferase involved in cell wall biosynthesis
MKNNDITPLHILVVEPRGTGGMIHYAYQLCTALSNAGAKVTLVTSSVYEMDGLPHDFALRKSMKLWSTIESQYAATRFGWAGNMTQKIYRGARRALRGIRFIIEWSRLVIDLIHIKPDVVQFGKIEFPFEAFFLKLLQCRGLTLSQIAHEFELREQGIGLLVEVTNRLYRWVYSSFSIIFFHGENNRQRFLSLFNVPQDRLYIIEHGNEDLFISNKEDGLSVSQMRVHYGIESDVPVVLFFGNLMPSKGLPDLLQAFALVHQRQNRTQLVVAGNPSKFVDMGKLKKMVADLKISDATILDTRYIPMEDVAALMGLSRVVVYPYLNSTQSGALQVAYTFGKPVIATTVGGLPEVVENGKSGILVPPASPTDLADAIMKFIENPRLADEMGAYAKHLSETRFSWDTIAQNILAIYSDKIRPIS